MGEEGWGVCRWQAAINYSFCHGPVIRKFIGNRAQWVRRPLAEFISRGEFHVPFIFQPKINERELLLFRKEIIGKIIIAKRKRTCTCFPASDRDISKYKRINRSIYERRSSRDETSKKKKKKRVHRRVSKRGGKGRGNVRQLYRSEKFPTILPSLNVPPLCSSKSTSKLTRFSFERASLSANSVAGVYATTDTDSRFVRDFVVRARIIGYLF